MSTSQGARGVRTRHRAQRVLDWLMPPGAEQLTRRQRERLRLSIGASLLFCGLALVVAATSYGLQGIVIGAQISFVTVLVMGGNAVAPRWLGASRLPGIIICSWPMAGVFLVAWSGAPSALVFCAIFPLMASFFSGPGWVAASTPVLALAVMLVPLPRPGEAPPDLLWFRLDVMFTTLTMGGLAILAEQLRGRSDLEREETQAELAASNAELARSNSDLQQFAYVASHDLQEPLRTVTSYAQLLARRSKGRLGEEGEEFIGFVVDGVERMNRLILGLLEYSRAGGRGGTFVPVDAGMVLARTLENLSLRIEESSAAVTSDPLPVVTADEVQLGQLLQNLVGNALKFRRPEQALRVHVSARRDGAFWVFTVRDNGIGIEPRHFERLFVLFQRLHTREEYPGTGIGLAVCKKIVERHGGQIRVESAPGQGTTFSFTLPVLPAEPRVARRGT